MLCFQCEPSSSILSLNMSSKPMTITLSDEIQRLLPPRVRRTAGFKAGDQLEVKAIGGIVTLISKPVVSDEDDEYTPEQRRVIDAHIAEGLDDIKHGRMSEAFSSHQEFISSLHKEAKKLRVVKTKRPAK